MKKTKEIMTGDLITINPNEPMAEAYRLMRSNNIRHLPVVDEEEQLVGMLSDRDIQRSMNVQKLNSFQQAAVITPDRKVQDFMSWPVYTVSESTSIEKVVEEMLSQKVSAFMVNDEKGNNKGIVTTDDLLALLLTMVKDDKIMKARTIANYFLSS